MLHISCDLFLWLQRYLVGPYTAAVTLFLTVVSTDSLALVGNAVAIIFILEIDNLLVSIVFSAALKGKLEEKMTLTQTVSTCSERSITRNVSMMIMFLWMTGYIVVEVLAPCGKHTPGDTVGVIVLASCLGFTISQVVAKFLSRKSPVRLLGDTSHEYVIKFINTWPMFLPPIIIITFCVDVAHRLRLPLEQATAVDKEYFAVTEFFIVLVIYHMGQFWGALVSLLFDFPFLIKTKCADLKHIIFNFLALATMFIASAAVLVFTYTAMVSQTGWTPSFNAEENKNVFVPNYFFNLKKFSSDAEETDFYKRHWEEAYKIACPLWAIGTIISYICKWIPLYEKTMKDKRLLAAYDKNGDGQVSTFEWFDHDGDGEVSITEVSAALFKFLYAVIFDLIYVIIMIVFWSYVPYTRFADLANRYFMGATENN